MSVNTSVCYCSWARNAPLLWAEAGADSSGTHARQSCVSEDNAKLNDMKETKRYENLKKTTGENQLPKIYVSGAEDPSRGQGPLQRVGIFSDPLPRGRVGQLVRI